MGTVDRDRIAAAVGEILAAVGDDPARPGVAETPRRVAELYAELFAGVGTDPADALGSTFGEAATQPVLLRDITFRSVCEHHLLPFEGVVHVAYLPRDRVAGLGGVVALVESASSRPQLQERLGEQIAEALERGLDARGALVVIDAKHGCVSVRGRRQTRSTTVTLAARGALAEPAARAELVALIAAPAAPTGSELGGSAGVVAGTAPAASASSAPGDLHG